MSEGIETSSPAILAPWIYLAESLPHCQESQELVDLLKGDVARKISSLLGSSEDHEFQIVDQISQYLKVNFIPPVVVEYLNIYSGAKCNVASAFDSPK